MKNLPLYLLCSFVVLSASGQTNSTSAPSTPAAQTQTQTQPQSQTPSVTTNVDEVALDLVVHDKKHKLILDLKPEDFAVTDNGAPVKLNDFHLVRGENNTRG